MRTIPMRALVVSSFCLWAACAAPPNTTKLPPAVSATNHRWFPLTTGTTHEFGKMTVDGAIDCNSCHRDSADSFTAIHCDQCHKHTEAITQRLHLAIPASFNIDTSAVSDPALKAELRGASCYACHPTGEKRAFSHTLITDGCAQCHAETNAFAALPKANFMHSDIGTLDCGACHTSTTLWTVVSAAPVGVSDPLRNLAVNALQPTWVGTTIVSVSPDPQSIHMSMNHTTTAIDAGVLAACANCHAQAGQSQYYPGVNHWSLTNLGVPQPATCSDCHGANYPKDFVGTIDNRRSPASGEMRHDAVVWSGNAPTTTRIVTMDCHFCHHPPANLIDGPFTFTQGRDDGGVSADGGASVPLFHQSLTEGGLPQPTSCIDCHANSRPVALVMAPSLTFDHSTALGDCITCHSVGVTWAGGKFHTATSPVPATCMPCHTSERPTSITGWMGTFLTSPFDYVTNGYGVAHGDDQDCAVCHSGPGTGVWGTNQNWRNGTFSHAATTVASTICIDCHTTQRPDQLIPVVDAGYDHASSGTGDCFACHQAAVATRGTYVNLLPIPGGDWRGGQSYPGARVISTPGQSVHLQTTLLNRTGSMVTSMTTGTSNLPNAFLHTSAAIPAAIAPGSATSPDLMSCWHCHTSTGTAVTAFANGHFHASLTNFKATPAGAVTPLAQPTACLDCHSTMRPPNVVSKTDAGTPWLLSMDHAATFTGGTVAGVGAMDCASCHRTPGLGATQWSDGQFHPHLPSGASPSECVSCHYPIMTTTAADVTFPAGLPSNYAMKHRSAQVTTQACATCHATALFNATMAPASTRWNPGTYHPSLTSTTQPTTCLECHGTSNPTAATQGTVAYTLPAGGTGSNGAQWMNHAHPSVTGKDCSTCHLTDAKVSGSAWNKAAPYHANATGLTSCATCHGITNGKGTVVGTNNNLPSGLTDSVTTTVSSAAPTGTHDQIAHTDLNVTAKDCLFCHTQVGPSTANGVQGVEWTKATFHQNFTTANPLLFNGSTARCSNCHLNVKPGTSYAQQDHSGFSGTSAQDCSSCHSWPGTSTTTPNWLGASGRPHATTGATAASAIDCNTCHGLGGSANKHLAVAAASHYGGITNGNKCTTCHIDFTGFKDVVTNLKYGHTNASANSGGCVTCHAFISSNYTTLTNTPTLPAGGNVFSQTTSVTGSKSGTSFNSPHTNSKMTLCGSCHQYSSTTASSNIWTFLHRPSNPGISSGTSTGGCNQCH